MSVTVLNTTASLSGKTLMKLEDSQTVTGAKTFDRGASAPFICISGSAKVDYLDADKLDGQTGADYHDAQLLTGVLPASVVAADPNADRIVFWDDSAGAFAYLIPGTALSISTTTLNVSLARSICQGRLTLTSGTPVTSADVTAAGTLYWALYGGNQVALYDGTLWQLYAVSELSIAVPAAADQVYDVFVDYNSGTPALALTAWTNDTTRATALTKQDGVLVLTGTLGKRYVGTVRTKTASQLNDSFAFRHVWNYYNRVPRPMRVLEATNTWPYTVATFQQANAAATNQLDCVVGVAEIPISVQVIGLASSDQAAGGVGIAVAIGEDATTPATGCIRDSPVNPGANIRYTCRADLYTFPAVGRHYYTWLELSTAVGVTTWSGDNGGTVLQTGIHGVIPG